MSIRIAASTVAFPGLAITELPDRAASLGLDGVAVTVFGRGSTVTADTAETEIRDFAARSRDVGVRVSAIYGYAGRAMLGGATARTADLDLARRCIDLGARLEAPLCRIFAWSGRPTNDLIDRFVEACLPIADHAASTGVMLGFPTHHDLAFDPASCRRLIAGFGRGRAGIIFNGPSMELDGIAPVTALHEMRDLVSQIEVKDWRRGRGRDHETPMPIGEGQATVWPLLETVSTIAFDGWVTLHHLKQHHPELPELERNTGEAVRHAVVPRVITSPPVTARSRDS